MIGIADGGVESSRQYHYCFVRHFEVPYIHMKFYVWIFETSSPGLYVANDVRLTQVVSGPV